jgi:hypothetical protein
VAELVVEPVVLWATTSLPSSFSATNEEAEVVNVAGSQEDVDSC